jgi:N,N'-diacetyllegionaminate synthase
MKNLKKRNHDKKLNLKKKVIIIAEIGLNHNGSFSLAKKSMLAAFKAGADLIKFQNFKTEDVFSNSAKKIKWNEGGKKKSLFDICKRNEFQKDWFKKLIKIAKNKGKYIFSTPHSISTTNDLLRQNISIVKNGSDYLTNLPLLNYFSRKFNTIILSTGMADEKQICDALKIINKGKASVILLHCTSLYPTPDILATLERMSALKDRFDLDIGFSDHTKGWLAATLAVGKGAKVIEKHFTLNKKMVGPDHWFSLDPKEFKNYVNKIRTAEKMLGTKTLNPTKQEVKIRHNLQVSMVFSRDLKKDTKLKLSHFDILKSYNKSLTFSERSKIIGKRLRKNKKIGDAINIRDVK